MIQYILVLCQEFLQKNSKYIIEKTIEIKKSCIKVLSEELIAEWIAEQDEVSATSTTKVVWWRDEVSRKCNLQQIQ